MEKTLVSWLIGSQISLKKQNKTIFFIYFTYRPQFPLLPLLKVLSHFPCTPSPSTSPSPFRKGLSKAFSGTLSTNTSLLSVSFGDCLACDCSVHLSLDHMAIDWRSASLTGITGKHLEPWAVSSFPELSSFFHRPKLWELSLVLVTLSWLEVDTLLRLLIVFLLLFTKNFYSSIVTPLVYSFSLFKSLFLKFLNMWVRVLLL